MFNPKVKHPIVAIIIWFSSLWIIQENGVVDGTMYLVNLVCCIALYKIISANFPDSKE